MEQELASILGLDARKIINTGLLNPGRWIVQPLETYLLSVVSSSEVVKLQILLLTVSHLGTVSEPQTWALSPPLPSFPPSRFFLHWLQTSITQSFIKLECFLIPFLRTRSHDGSAHTFRSSLWFLKVLQKGLKKYVLAFFNHIFWHIWSYQIH